MNSGVLLDKESNVVEAVEAFNRCLFQIRNSILCASIKATLGDIRVSFFWLFLSIVLWHPSKVTDIAGFLLYLLFIVNLAIPRPWSTFLLCV